MFETFDDVIPGVGIRGGVFEQVDQIAQVGIVVADTDQRIVGVCLLGAGIVPAGVLFQRRYSRCRSRADGGQRVDITRVARIFFVLPGQSWYRCSCSRPQPGDEFDSRGAFAFFRIIKQQNRGRNGRSGKCAHDAEHFGGAVGDILEVIAQCNRQWFDDCGGVGGG